MSGRYPLPEGAVRAFDNARYWADELAHNGIREAHGLEPARPLTPAQRRDADTICRAVGRLFDSTR